MVISLPLLPETASELWEWHPDTRSATLASAHALRGEASAPRVTDSDIMQSGTANALPLSKYCINQSERTVKGVKGYSCAIAGLVGNSSKVKLIQVNRSYNFTSWSREAHLASEAFHYSRLGLKRGYKLQAHQGRQLREIGYCDHHHDQPPDLLDFPWCVRIFGFMGRWGRPRCKFGKRDRAARLPSDAPRATRKQPFDDPSESGRSALLPFPEKGNGNDSL
ncbi:hypothetical protein H4582DRAFT_2051370 [Lactarius indigo]|nr:hypothetical protein H4582DRAFT_2051370 [Lactarius indigo]